MTAKRVRKDGQSRYNNIGRWVDTLTAEQRSALFQRSARAQWGPQKETPKKADDGPWTWPIDLNRYDRCAMRKQQFEREQAEIEAERNRKAEILKAREAIFNGILENAPPTFTPAQLRVFLRALVNLDPYTLTEDVAEHFAGDDENHQQTAEEILASALAETRDEKLTSFALRITLTGYVAIPPEAEFDFLSEAAATFVPPQSPKEKKAKKAPTPIKTATKKTATKKKVAA